MSTKGELRRAQILAIEQDVAQRGGNGNIAVNEMLERRRDRRLTILSMAIECANGRNPVSVAQEFERFVS